MYLLIKDVLQLFQNKSISLVAGFAGLDNIVSSANIMDAPDILNWVKPGDLILTTAYIVKDNPVLQERLIRELSTIGAAGLGIKTKRFLPEIPPIIKKTAEKLNFPILDLPLDLSLSEIMNPIISSIADKQSYVLHRTIEIQKTLNRVAIQGEGLRSIITCLSTLTQCPAGCYDVNGAPLVHWVPEKLPGIDNNILKKFDTFLKQKVTNNDSLQDLLAQTKSPCTQNLLIENNFYFITSFPVMSDNESFGHISIIQITDTFLDINCIALEQTCIVAALDFAKQKAIIQSRRIYSRDILEYILIDDPSKYNLDEILSGSRLKKAKFFECWIIQVDERETVNVPVILTRLYKATQQLLTSTNPLSIVSERAGKIIVLAASTNEFIKDPHLGITLHNIFHNIYPSLKISIGVGTIATELSNARQSYHNALTCLRIGQQIKGTGQVTFPYEVACYSILENYDSAALVSQIFDSIIQKLENSDADLLKTLEKYLECDKRLTETSNELYIHRNTLSNRLERIADIVSLDFNNKELVFCLRLALRQRKFNKSHD
ncbi:purine catabolism regulator [Sporomusaceae bacterium BoRhaA]|uniref:PucR family transcriptional regulator n=1 Tax=Pelorhabdus rhamnosifermentans TaxID=2772457 RepID=UPI001C060E2A|nr:PucR family transcriptional regulator ligand-binding domain-containing protein [Pelorhabdus rhamnosifermentans]MBU2702490.1 purine catabolism regulator [Pelorhabdus rhamnosifermentans]